MPHTDSQFDIKSSTEDDLLSITASGSYSLAKANHLFKFAIDTGVLHNKSKILIDVTKISGAIPFMDRFYYSEFLASYRINNALSIVNSIAIVGHEPIVHKEKFGETVAVNRGTNVKVFTDTKAASIWLQEQ